MAGSQFFACVLERYQSNSKSYFCQKCAKHSIVFLNIESNSFSCFEIIGYNLYVLNTSGGSFSVWEKKSANSARKKSANSSIKAKSCIQI